MPEQTHLSRIDAATCKKISALSHAFVRNCHHQLEQDDVSQDILCYLLEQAPKFEPEAMAWTDFVVRAAQQKWQRILRNLERQKRCAELCSLDEPLGESSMATLGDTLVDPATENHVRPWDIYEKQDLIREVRTLVAALPVGLKEVAEALMEHEPKEAMRRLGLKRTTFYERMARLKEEAVRKLCRKQVIEEARLHAYKLRGARQRRDYVHQRKNR